MSGSEGPSEHDQVRTNATKSVAALLVRGVAIRALGLVGNIVLARLLAPEDFGVIAFALTLTVLGNAFASGGLGAALVQRREAPTDHELGAVLGFQLLTTVGLAVGVGALGALLIDDELVPILMALSLPIDALRVPVAIAAERSLKYGPLVRAEVLETLAFNVVGIALVAAGLGVVGVGVAVVVRAVVGAVVLIVFGPIGATRPRWDMRVVRPLLRFGVAFQSAGLVSLLRDHGVNFIAAAAAGLAAVGYWAVAWRLLQSIQLVLESLWRVLFPAFVRVIELGVDAAPTLRRAIERVTVIAGFVIVAVGGSAPALVPVVFGDNWSETAQVLPLGCLGVLLWGPIGTCVVGYLYATDRAGLALRLSGLYAVTWCLVMTPLLPSLGVLAIGIGMAAGAAVGYVAIARSVAPAVGLGTVTAGWLPIVLAVGAGTASWLVCREIESNGLALIASLAVGQALYVTAVMVLRRRVVLDLRRLVGDALRTS